jgi:hypothetical protein
MENLIFDDNLSDPNVNASFINTIAGELVDIGRDFLDLEDEEEPEMDHVSFGGLKFLNFEYFDKKTKNLPGFEGFAPRYTLVTRLRNIKNSRLNTSALFLIIVCYHIAKSFRTHGKR